jgi:predicted secreted protein
MHKNRALFLSVTAICLALILFLTVTTRTPQVKAQSPLQWTLTTNIEEQSLALEPTHDPETPIDFYAHTVQEKLNDPNIQVAARRVTVAEKTYIELTISGNGDVEQLRSILHSRADALPSLISGYSHILIEADFTAWHPVEIVLDSNISTGYSWSVDPVDLTAYTEKAADQYESVSENIGSKQKQHITLNARQDGPIILDLYYRRPWENYDGQVTRNTLTIQAGTIGGRLDLSGFENPLPVITAVRNLTGITLNPSPDGTLFDRLDLWEVVKSLPAVVLINPFSGNSSNPSPTVLPDYFSWGDTGKLTPIRDQGACGTCWAFSAAGIMESDRLIAGGTSQDLSEQYLVSCNNDGFNRLEGGINAPYSCDWGGWSWDAHDYHIDQTGRNGNPVGAVLESTFGYTSGGGSIPDCYTLSAADHPHKLASKTYVYPSNIHSIPPVDILRQAILDHGPISVDMCAGPTFQSLDNGYMLIGDESDHCPYSSGINHAVILVGWFENPTYGGFWIVKNSWGTDWGTDGYGYIKWGISHIGYEANYVTYILPPPSSDFSKLSPEDGTAGLGFHHQSFAWEAATNATSYKICIDSFPNAACSATWISSPTNLVWWTDLFTGTTYEWQVKASNTTGDTEADFGNWFSFTTAGTLGDDYEPDNGPGEATQVFADGFPRDHSIVPLEDQDWVRFTLPVESAVTLHTSGPEFGDTEIFLVDGSGTDIIEYNDDGGAVLFYSLIDRLCGVDALPAGTYYLHVRSMNNFFELPNYQLTYTSTACVPYDYFNYLPMLLKPGDPPAAFGKISPDDADHKPLTGIQLDWEDSMGASSYQYCYDTTLDGVCTGSWISTGATSQVGPLNFAGGAAYEWQVKALNSSGTTYADDEVNWTFSTISLSPFTQGFETGIVPPPHWTQITTNPDYTWEIYTGYAHSGTYNAMVEDNPGTYPQDEVLISQPFATIGGTVSFFSASNIFWCRDEHDNCDLQVWVVKGDWDAGAGDDVLLGTADDDWVNNYVYALSSFDFTPYVTGGQTIRIAFRYVGPDADWAELDDITITY